MYGTTKSPQESLEKAIELTQQVIAQDDSASYGHAILGWLYCLKREYDKAVAEGERGVALDPSGAMVHAFYAVSLTAVGRPEEAIPLFKKAIRLNPFGPAWYFWGLGQAYRSRGWFEEAVPAYKKALQLSPDNLYAHLGLGATYSMMGREKEARAEAAEVLRINPKFSVDPLAKRQLYKDRSEVDKLVDALHKAGLK